jgi:hypothetical protein
MGLLDLPEFQSTIAPFFTAFVVGLLLRQFNKLWTSAGVILGFLVTAWLVNGFTFEPLSVHRKIILLGVFALIVGGLVDLYLAQWRNRTVALSILSAVCLLWVIWPVMVRQEGWILFAMAVGGIVYLAWLTAWLDWLATDPLKTASAAAALGIGTGITAILGASALLGQLASAIGAAAGAFFLLALSFRDTPAGSVLTFPTAILCGTLGFSTLIYAELPWFTLVLLALIPLGTYVPVVEKYPRWVQAAQVLTITLVIAAAAIFSVWFVTEESPY